MTKELIFIYAVDGGLFTSLINYAHKILSPNTYACKLCSLTYGAKGAEKLWTSFIANIGLKTTFLHKDEFLKIFPDLKIELPAVYIKTPDTMKLALNAQEITNCQSLGELMNLVKHKCL